LKLENLNQIIENFHLILSAEAKKRNHRIELNLEEDLSLILLDFKQIRQLIFNLVSNGLEAMTSAGTLSITTNQTCETVILSIED